jgi:hypothetical protein
MPYIAWMIHAVMYLLAYLILNYLDRVNPVFFNLWSAALQIQGYLTVLIVEVARFYRQKGKQKGVDIGC